MKLGHKAIAISTIAAIFSSCNPKQGASATKRTPKFDESGEIKDEPQQILSDVLIKSRTLIAEAKYNLPSDNPAKAWKVISDSMQNIQLLLS